MWTCFSMNDSVYHLYFFSLSLCPPAKNVFRVTSLDPTHGQSHTLQVNDVFHKQQWLNCLRSAINAQPQQQRAPLRDQHSEATTMTRAKRRSSVVSMSDMVGGGGR